MENVVKRVEFVFGVIDRDRIVYRWSCNIRRRSWLHSARIDDVPSKSTQVGIVVDGWKGNLENLKVRIELAYIRVSAARQKHVAGNRPGTIS